MAAAPPSGGFGGRLREARERRGVSLRQIANATKISMAALEALERNDISRLPGGIFSRAFVRSYAIEVGLDPEDTIQEFIEQFPHDSVTAGHPRAHRLDRRTTGDDRQVLGVVGRLVAVAIPVLGIVLYLGSAVWPWRARSDPDPGVARYSVGGRASGVLGGGERGQPAPTAGVGSATVRPDRPDSSERLAIVVSASGPCWLSVAVDGLAARERQLASGEQERFDVRQEIVLSVRDAGCVTMIVNGARARALGRQGEKAMVRLTPATAQEYLVRP